MKSIKISLEQAQRVKDFVAITQECDFEILLKSGKYVVDAKSILGIFSLDLSNPLTVLIYIDYCAELLEKRLKQVEEYHSPDAETDARVQGDTAFKVECESPVIPEPSSGGALHDVAADQLYNGCDHDDPDEDQERCDQEPACVDTPFLEPGQRQDEDQRSEAIYDAVRAEQNPSV